MVVGVGLCFVIGLAQFFVASFKSAAILPNDLFVLGTAAAVSGGYTYAVGGGVVLGLACLLLACAAGALVVPTPAAARGRRVAANLGCAAALLALLVAGVTVPSYFDDLGVEMKYWYSLDYYRRQGFITSFVAVAQDLPIDVPDGYDKDSAARLEADYVELYDEGAGATAERAAAEEQFEQERPSVVCIMNESFADLSALGGESWGYSGPSFVNSVDDALAHGDLAVSVLGGGTCNTEFEFLTGVSLAYIGDGKYPYSLYDLSSAPSIARQFSELGYQTTAMHPNYATNWNRDRVYEALGFDTFLSIDDFAGAETYHSGVSDEETYDKCLELLENGDDPQFIFNVTMQNHSGYDTGLLPSNIQTNYLIDGTYDPEVNEYLALIEQSDQALEEFIGKLQNLDRPVVVVFFGDHQPFFPSDFNDAWYQNEDEATHSERLYHTSYVIWANYDVAGREQTSSTEDISTNFLGAEVMNLIGAPLSDYQKAQLSLRESMPAINIIGYQDSSGSWYLTGTDTSGEGGSLSDALAAASKAREDLAKMQYLKLFDHGDSVFTKTLQGAANETNPNLAPGTTKIQ